MNLARGRVAPTRDVLAETGVHVDPASLLGPAERERHDRLRLSVDRTDFVAARALARMLVLDRRRESLTAARLRSVVFVQQCETCGGPHGRPTIRGGGGLEVSWAHAKGVVGAAIADGPVGLDVERMSPDPPPGLAGDGPAPWLRWARAEALTKLGRADLETTVSWSEWFDRPARAEGRRVELPEGTAAWIADGVDEQMGVVWAIARDECSTTA